MIDVPKVEEQAVEPLAEVRQCQDSLDPMYGASAVQGTGLTAGKWGVMHPVNGGHWADDAEVANWEVLS
jgi:hypothetical protein